METGMETEMYMGIPGHVRLTNGHAELLVSTDYGPRIIRYALAGGENVFGEIPPGEHGKETPFGDDWYIYGGHRLWYAPEDPVRTYWPDNEQVAAELHDLSLTVTQPVEPHTRLEKQMVITLDPQSSCVTVLHRIKNHGAFDVELAVWGSTVMARGGFGVYPNEPFVPFPEGLLPVQPLVLWPYTRLRDDRWTFGDLYLRLRQDPSRKEPQKIGMYSRQGWMAYLWRDLVFVKCYDPQPGPHTDFGCNVESFTNDEILELETLGPLVKIAPHATAEHTERWRLFKAQVSGDDASVAAALAPLVEQAMRGD
jgi:hypothetical protein